VKLHPLMYVMLGIAIVDGLLLAFALARFIASH
jgi:hypothetical protein